jgi:hypothetical protein
LGASPRFLLFFHMKIGKGTGYGKRLKGFDDLISFPLAFAFVGVSPMPPRSSLLKLHLEGAQGIYDLSHVSGHNQSRRYSVRPMR